MLLSTVRSESRYFALVDDDWTDPCHLNSSCDEVGSNVVDQMPLSLTFAWTYFIFLIQRDTYFCLNLLF